MVDVQILEDKNRQLTTQLDDMSKKVDWILEIQKFLIGQLPGVRNSNIPDELKELFNNYKM